VAADPLGRVRRAAARKRRADAEYKAALLEGLDELEEAGVRDPFAQLADAAERSRQILRQQIVRWLDKAEDDT
jgi:hypothetical protein